MKLSDGYLCPVSIEKKGTRCEGCNLFHIIVTCLVRKLEEKTVVCKAVAEWKTQNGNLEVILPYRIVDLPKLWEGIEFLWLSDYEKWVYHFAQMPAIPDVIIHAVISE